MRNVQNLERSAEEMSQSGSDLGEEIRRLSRQSSVQSSRNGDINVVRPNVLERMNSSRSSRSGSYSRVNGAARWAGYSSEGFVTSPVGSVSGWSHPSPSRVTSNPRSSRLAHVSEPMQEGKPLDSPLRTSFSIREGEQDDEPEQDRNDDTLHARDISRSSFSRHYDEIAGQIEDSLQHVPPSPPKHNADVHRNQALHRLEVAESGTSIPPERPRSTDTFREAQEAFLDFDGVHFSPDTEEFVELDQDGKEIRRVSARSISGGLSFRAASLLRTPRAQPAAQGEPPPPESMVYYPAPVPRILNLPKRLSQLPAASVQSKRRTQVLSQLPPEAKAAGPWLADADFGGPDGHNRQSSAQHSRGTGSSESAPRAFLNERMSGNVGNVPAHLRADMFFEHPSIQQNVEIQCESAVATLDSILNASATAPVRAFTDHPFSGDVRKSVYSLEKTQRRSTATTATQSTPEKKKKRQSSGSIAGILKRSSTDELTTTLKKRGSRVSILDNLTESGNKLRKRTSRLSLGDELDRDNESVKTPGDEMNEPEFRSGLIAGTRNAAVHDGDNRVSFAPTIMSSGYQLDDADKIEQDFKEEEEQEDVEEEDPMFVQPSTLLAELQVRKAQQKKRNKTAATAFPNGMHSTLLELDAVDEINKRKRQKQRIALAWEDPHQRALEADLDKGDEDVPLAMLFPPKNGGTARRVGDGKDWDRPLGLMEKRELEDNEPLSSRRNRLQGRPPPSPKNVPEVELMQDAEGEAEEDEEGETLAQRMRRMKTKDALDTAISDVAPKNGSRPVSTFTDDVMGQFGGQDEAKGSPDPENPAGASPQPEQEETLGQRRARLQREREAAGEQRNISDPAATAARPPIVRSSSSFANLLASNPIGTRAAAKNHEPASGSLLATNATVEARQKTALRNTNLRSSSYHLEKPLVDSRPQNTTYVNASGLLAQQHNSRAAAGGFAAGTYNNGMGGIQLQQTMGTPNFAIPTAGYGMGYPTAGYGYGNAMGYPQMQMQQQYQAAMHPMPYAGQGAMTGMMAGNTYMNNSFIPQTMSGGTYASYAQSMGGLGYGALATDEGLDPNQKAAIDRWRMGIGS